MVLFLVALGMLFAASLLAYVLVRVLSRLPLENPVTGVVTPSAAPALGSVPLPWPLWVSTGVIVAASLTMHAAVRAVRREDQRVLNRSLRATLGLAVLFLLVQTPALIMLLIEHRAVAGGEGGVEGGSEGGAVYGLLFTLIVIHALHLLGGLIPLAVVTRRARRGGYDHEAYGPVLYLAMYWHFLDAVWLVMFATLWVVT